MASKKFLILPVVISLIGHALLISATGLVDMRSGNRKQESIFTVNLEDVHDRREEAKEIFSPPPPPEPEKESGLSENTVQINNPGTKYASYLKGIKKKIENIWSYPRQASERKKEGTNTIKFSLDKNGRLVASRIIKSSGDSLLDRETMNAIRSASPYDPFPGDINLSRLHILATFHYRLFQ